jgi:hypothetical protein
MANTKKCEHPSCKCMAKEGAKFCSTYCEGKGDSPDIRCDCGHTACQDKA